MIRFLLLLFIVLSFSNIYSQGGEMQGQVIDPASGKPISFANIRLVSKEFKGTGKGARSDDKGRYSIKNIPPGFANAIASFAGKYDTIFDIPIKVGIPTTVNFEIGTKNVLKGAKITGKKKYKVQLVDKYDQTKSVVSSEDLTKSSNKNDVMSSVASSSTKVTQEDNGKKINIAGAREDDNVIFIDGVKTKSTNIQSASVSNIEVMTSGVPAKYGDLTGGVISITTKGPSDKLTGSIDGLTSKFLDPFEQTIFGANLSGPLLKKKSVLDSGNKITFIGFSIGGEYQKDLDRFPAIQGSWKVKDDVFEKYDKTPYILDNNNEPVLIYETLKMNDLEHNDIHQNTSGEQIRLNGKIDVKLNEKKGINLTLGSRYSFDKYNDLLNRYQLLNYSNNRVVEDKLLNGFVRLYMPLVNKDKDTGKIRNAYFQLQADIENSGKNSYSPIAKYNHFDYGYIGKFSEKKIYDMKTYEDKEYFNAYYSDDNFLKFSDAVVISGFKGDGVLYESGKINAPGAKLTQSLYDLVGSKYKTIDEFDKIAVINGERANVFLHDVFYPYGRVYNGFEKEDNLQFRTTGFVNFDLVNKKSQNLNKHNIEIGVELEKKYSRKYGVSGVGSFWELAKNNSNQHLSLNLEKNFNPLLIMQSGNVKMRYSDYIKQLYNDDAVLFGANDTIFYDKEVSNKPQFSAMKIREALGVSIDQRINVHEIDPSILSLDMFSADEILNSNVNLDYYGYDYKGNLSSIDAKFEDFFTEKDKNGNNKRTVEPYAPIYAAGYIMDRFELDKISFNIGIRADYFNSNQNALKDRYVLQGAYTTNDIDASKFGLSSWPEHLKGATIYGDDLYTPNSVIGYRKGDKWYSKDGSELNGPSFLISQTGSLKPYLIGNTDEEKEKRDINSSTFDPNTIFRKTESVINILPRLNFSFQVDTHSLFFAHFDMLAQRPEEFRFITSSIDYYNVFAKTNTRINNPELKTPKSTDLEFGFKQKIGKSSALTINFFYREFLDQIQITKLVGAYPKEYQTFANSDFSSVKGFGLAYELRRTGNLKLRANYTMQFANGTGSSATSQLSLINANQGNLKIINPLNFDYRHNLNFNVDYRYLSASNPDFIGPSNKSLRKVLENFGVNLTANLRSGSPYTLQQNASDASYISPAIKTTTLGDINSASKPWQYTLGLKLDKDFYFKVGKKKDSTSVIDNKRDMSLNVFLQIRNLLNTYNVLNVYKYTGTAETDGFLDSESGLLQYNVKEASLKGKGDSFRDLYNISYQLPDDVTSYYRQPRIMQIGASLTF